MTLKSPVNYTTRHLFRKPSWHNRWEGINETGTLGGSHIPRNPLSEGLVSRGGSVPGDVGIVSSGFLHRRQ